MISGILLSLIITFEGFHAHAYWDVNGYAIGYGHHGPEVTSSLVYTKEKASRALVGDVESIQRQLQRASPSCISYCRIGISDFIYNLGWGAYNKSSLKVKIDKKDWIGAQHELKRWVHVRGRVSPGLIRRRAAEASLLGEMK